MTKSLDGKVALVTGASRGIGRAIAETFAADGALVAVHFGASQDAATETVRRIEAAGGRAFAIGADLASADGPRALFAALDQALETRVGSTALDILVNNAGQAPFGGLDELSDEAFDELYALNIRALYKITQLAAARLRDGGRIINQSSAVTRVGVPAALAYSASKGWVDSFTRSAASHFAPRNITVNAIAPGVIETDMSAPMLVGGPDFIIAKQALKRVGQPRDVAGVARFLAGPDGGWVTGQIIDASGGSGIAF